MIKSIQIIQLWIKRLKFFFKIKIKLNDVKISLKKIFNDKNLIKDLLMITLKNNNMLLFSTVKNLIYFYCENNKFYAGYLYGESIDILTLSSLVSKIFFYHSIYQKYK